jgi:hypothetical protein
MHMCVCLDHAPEAWRRAEHEYGFGLVLYWSFEYKRAVVLVLSMHLRLGVRPSTPPRQRTPAPAPS